MTIEEHDKLMKDLFAGKTVKCPQCKKGSMVPNGKAGNSSYYHCNKCDCYINVCKSYKS